jgi:hypothetical protein
MTTVDSPQPNSGDAPGSATRPDATPITIPVIDFNAPTGDQMVEVRKGFGLSEVGGTSRASRRSA